MRRLLQIYLKTVSGIIQRNVGRGRATPERASEEAAHVFAGAGLMNIASVIALVDVVSALSHLQWFALLAVTYGVLYQLHHRLIVKTLLPWCAEASGSRAWNVDVIVGSAYLLLSPLLLGASLALLGARANGT